MVSSCPATVWLVASSSSYTSVNSARSPESTGVSTTTNAPGGGVHMRLAGSGSEKARGVATLGQFSPGAGGLVFWMSGTTTTRRASGRAPPNKAPPINWATSAPPILWITPRRASTYREAPRRAGAGAGGSTYERSVGGLRMRLRQEALSGAAYHESTVTASPASRRSESFTITVSVGILEHHTSRQCPLWGSCAAPTRRLPHVDRHRVGPAAAMVSSPISERTSHMTESASYGKWKVVKPIGRGGREKSIWLAIRPRQRVRSF